MLERRVTTDIIPVRKLKGVEQFNPKHLLNPFEGRTPKVDIIDRDDEVFIRAELPGVDKKDIEVSIADNILTIKALTMREIKNETGYYYRCEITKGNFSRSMSLPAEVNIEASLVEFKDGLLDLKLPKIERVKRRKSRFD